MKFSVKKRGAIPLLILFLFLVGAANASHIIKNENVIKEIALSKIEEIGAELKEKTGVGVYVYALETTSPKTFAEFSKEVSQIPAKPYVVLLFAKSDKKVDIISSSDLDGKFGKEEILSPYPWSGSIIPILSAKAEGDAPTAAILNGYADISERVAKLKGVTLVSAIGDENRVLIRIVKYIVYATILLAFGAYFYRKFLKK